MKKMSTTQQQLTLSLKLSLLLTESGTSVDGWFGSSWSKWIACTKKVRIIEFSLQCIPHLIHSQTIWAPDGEDVLVSGFVNVQLFSPARVHQLHILAKLVLDVAYCRGQLSTKDDRSGKGRVNAGRKNTQNSTQWGLTGQDLTCGGATGLADCSWWGRAPLLSWNNQATPEVVRFKECKIFIFLKGVNDHSSLKERENFYFAEEVFFCKKTHIEKAP